ncbi:MAG TPA: hypothetical protein VM164_15195 [Burkholderiales bacterium]|nr:hypothetical protein [Burkholderiales bacterium]
MWKFEREANRAWVWKELDSMGQIVRRSTLAFRERIDCIAHAMRNGYIHPRQRALGARVASSDSPEPKRSRRWDS